MMSSCRPTEGTIEGPFWRPGAPFRGKLSAEDEEGDVLFVSGRVLGHPGCAPLPGALLDVWRANRVGLYDSQDPRCRPGELRLRGRVRAGEDGSYELETVVPAPYRQQAEFRPAHIHLKVSSPGYVPLTTQMYFEGDLHLEGDPHVRPSLILALRRRQSEDDLKERGLPSSFRTCLFDVVLASRPS